MRLSNLVVLLLVVTLGSLATLSSTLARYNNNYSGADSAAIARWNFRVGATEDNLHNQGFTFDVFNNQELSPQDMGENSFVISGGQSDVAIDYEVYMNVKALQVDINGFPEGTDYPPLIFYLKSLSATVNPPYDYWFTLKDVEADEEGYFLVATGSFEANSSELHSITIHWWWNTSFYVGIPNDDTSTTGNYYAIALNEYDSLVQQYNYLVNQANAFFDEHKRIVTTVDGVETVTYDCPAGSMCPITLGAEGGDIDAAHIAAHAAILAEVDLALEAVNNSLKCQYDRYDTQTIATLKSLEDSVPEGILIKVVGKQVVPEI
jgi:hypothetical protein